MTLAGHPSFPGSNGARGPTGPAGWLLPPDGLSEPDEPALAPPEETVGWATDVPPAATVEMLTVLAVLAGGAAWGWLR